MIVGQTYECDGSATVKVNGEPKRCVVGGSQELIVFHANSRVVILDFLPGFRTVMASANGKTGSGKRVAK